MKKIICYGDSNTFGFNPKNGSRYNNDTRWTGILSKILGSEYDVKEEGCNNRTAFFENAGGLIYSGQIHLPHCLEQHKRFDILILALGTNDLQKIYDITPIVVSNGLKTLTFAVLKSNPTAKIILITPVLLDETVSKGPFCSQFDKKSIESSFWLQNEYRVFAAKNGFELMDLNKFVTPSHFDGLHFEQDAHKIIAEQIAKKILQYSESSYKTDALSSV